MNPTIVFRCDICAAEIRIPIDKLTRIPVCPTHDHPMSTVGNIRGVNEALGDAMDALARLVAAALCNDSIAVLYEKEDECHAWDQE